jgi:hypothetical protein
MAHRENIIRAVPGHLRGRPPGLLVLAAALCTIVAVVSATAQEIFYRDARAKDLFETGRIAIFGGPGGIARLRSFALKGKSRIPASDGALVDADVDLRVLLPDHYLRIDSGSFGRRLTGYAGRTVLSAVESGGKRSVPDARDAAAVVRAAQTELARLVLGVAAYVSQEVPLKLGTKGTRVAMPGPADPLGIEAYSDDGFAARLIFDGPSHLPVKVVYWDSDRRVLTMALMDRQPVSGVNFPRRIVTTAGDRVVDEMSFGEIVINPPLSKADFSAK